MIIIVSLLDQGAFHIERCRHPGERKAAIELQEDAAFVALTQDVASLKAQLHDQAEAKLFFFLVTPETAPDLYHLYREVLTGLSGRQLLDTQFYPLFIEPCYDIRIIASGSDTDGYYLIISSAAVEELNDAEIRALLGIGIGHILAGHSQFNQAIHAIESGTSSIPLFGSIASKSIISKFTNWRLYSEYTADCAAAIAAGGIEPVLSLFWKIAGLKQECQNFDKLECPMPKQEIPPDSLPFLWLHSHITSFNIWGRMAELQKWACSDTCRDIYPFIYYSSCEQVGLKPKDEKERQLFELHKKARHGEPGALAALGEAYLTGRNGLPLKKEIGLSLVMQAALSGNPDGMIIWAVCIRSGVNGVVGDKVFMEQLLRAAASRRNLPAASETQKLEQLVPVRGLDKLIFAAYRNSPDGMMVGVDDKSPGSEITDDVADKLRESFVIPLDAKIFAYTYNRKQDLLRGMALCDVGIFGRCEGVFLPFFIDWVSFSARTLTIRPIKHGRILYSGETPLCRLPDRDDGWRGTIAELVITAKAALDK